MPDTEQPDTTGQDQASTPDLAAAPQPVPVTTAPSPGDGPWSKDLAELFQDEAVRGQVDQFLRTKIQPHTTQLEQQLAQSQDAQRVYNDLTENPVETTFALINEVYGQEAAQAFAAQLQGGEQPQVEEPQGYGYETQQLDPRVEQAVSFIEQQQAEQAYEEEMARIVAEHPGLDPEDLHAYVAAADGDFDSAYLMYEDQLNRWNSRNATPEEQQTAPPVMGDGQTTPPTTQEHKTLGDAIDSFLAANRPTQDPPPVA